MYQAESDSDEKLEISVVAAGAGGARAVKKMAGRIRGVDYFGKVEELICRPGQIAVGSELPPLPAERQYDEESLQSAMRGTDLAFVVTFLEDESVASAAVQFAEAATREGALVIGVTAADSPSVRALAAFDTELRITRDCLVPGDETIPLVFGKPGLTDYLMRHAVAEITSLIVERGLICIDYADVKAILTGGGDTFMAIGVAFGPEKGNNAAANAIKGLAAQNVDPGKVNGILANVMGSTNMTMDDFDNASRVIHEAIPQDAAVVCGCTFDEALGDNVKVTLFAN